MTLARTPLLPLVIPRPSSQAHPPGNHKTHQIYTKKKKNRSQAHDSEVAYGARQAETLCGSRTHAEAVRMPKHWLTAWRTCASTSTGINTGRPQIYL